VPGAPLRRASGLSWNIATHRGHRAARNFNGHELPKELRDEDAIEGERPRETRAGLASTELSADTVPIPTGIGS
jgi:hypothetical protein